MRLTLGVHSRTESVPAASSPMERTLAASQGVSWSVIIDLLRTGEAVDFRVASGNRMTAVARQDEVALHVLFSL
jgi:hypothetical protein